MAAEFPLDALSEATEAVDLVVARRRHLNELASQESRRLYVHRSKQRQELTANMLNEQQRYFDQISAAFRSRRERSEQRTQSSPFLDSQLTEFHRAERRRGRPGEHRARAEGEREFREVLNTTFAARSAMRDEFAELRKEKRELLAQERQLWMQMEAEKSRMKQLRAAERRPSYSEDVQARKEMRLEKERVKQEFLRSLTGWDGRKGTRRTQSVKNLWNEHSNKLSRSQSCSAVHFDGYESSSLQEDISALDPDLDLGLEGSRASQDPAPAPAPELTG